MNITRRWLLALAAAALLGACAQGPSLEQYPPVVFVHGNGDSASNWTATMWRFESNGWPRERLHAIDMPLPLARDDDTKPQAGRSSAAEHAAFLKSEVDKVLRTTGARQVVLFGNSVPEENPAYALSGSNLNDDMPGAPDIFSIAPSADPVVTAPPQP